MIFSILLQINVLFFKNHTHQDDHLKNLANELVANIQSAQQNVTLAYSLITEYLTVLKNPPKDHWIAKLKKQQSMSRRFAASLSEFEQATMLIANGLLCLQTQMLLGQEKTDKKIIELFKKQTNLDSIKKNQSIESYSQFYLGIVLLGTLFLLCGGVVLGVCGMSAFGAAIIPLLLGGLTFSIAALANTIQTVGHRSCIREANKAVKYIEVSTAKIAKPIAQVNEQSTKETRVEPEMAQMDETR